VRVPTEKKAMNENIDAFVCKPDVFISKALTSVGIQFEVMNAQTGEGTGTTHTVGLTSQDAMWLLLHLQAVQKQFSLPIPKAQITVTDYSSKKPRN
jgi:hypothetical protein